MYQYFSGPAANHSLTLTRHLQKNRIFTSSYVYGYRCYKGIGSIGSVMRECTCSASRTKLIIIAGKSDYNIFELYAHGPCKIVRAYIKLLYLEVVAGINRVRGSKRIKQNHDGVGERGNTGAVTVV